MAVFKNAYNPAGASLGNPEAASLLSVPQVASRIARASYGTYFGYGLRHVSPPVDSSKDDVYLNREGFERVERMKWFLKKVRSASFVCATTLVLANNYQGESVQNKSPVTYDFKDNFEGPQDKTLSIEIYVSDANPPPIRRDASVKELCKIQCEIEIPWKDMEEMRDSKGRLLSCRKAKDLVLSMSFGGAPKWTLQAGSQTTELDADVEYL